MKKDHDGNSLNIVWEGITLHGKCEVCNKEETFEIWPDQRSFVMKGLFPKMIAWAEYKHTHEEVPDASQEREAAQNDGCRVAT